MNYQYKQRYSTTTSKILLILSVVLAAIALLAFFFAGLIYLSDQGNPLQLLVDVSSMVKLGVMGFISFFLSYLLLLGSVLIDV